MEAKQQLRDSLAEQMAAFEATNGPIVTQPTFIRGDQENIQDSYRRASFARQEARAAKKAKDGSKVLKAAPRRRSKKPADLVAERISAMSKDLEAQTLDKLKEQLEGVELPTLRRIAKDFALSQLKMATNLQDYGLKIQVDRKWTEPEA